MICSLDMLTTDQQPATNLAISTTPGAAAGHRPVEQDQISIAERHLDRREIAVDKSRRDGEVPLIDGEKVVLLPA